MTSSFSFPPVRAGSPQPQWDGAVFRMGAESQRVLFYGESQSGWSEDLSLAREEATGPNHPIDKASRGYVLQVLRSHFNASAPVILEVGSLSGHTLRDIRAAMPAATVIGSDYLQQGLVEVAPSVPGIPLVQFDLKACPLPDASVDAVVALNVLEHIDDDARAVAEIARILRPGGIAVVEVPAGPGLYDFYDKFWMHYRRYRMADLVGLMESAGLRTVERTHLGFFVYPAFWLVKKLNRLRPGDGPVEAVVLTQNVRTRHSLLMRAAMAVEDRLRPWLWYPVGIRCAIVCRKPPLQRDDSRL